MKFYSKDEALVLAWLDLLQTSTCVKLPEIQALIAILQKKQDANTRLQEFNLAKDKLLSLSQTTWTVFFSYILNRLPRFITNILPEKWLKPGQKFIVLNQLLSTAPVIEIPVVASVKSAPIEITNNSQFEEALYSDHNAIRQDLRFRNQKLPHETQAYLERLHAARELFEPSDYQHMLTKLIKKAPKEAFGFFYTHADKKDIFDIYNFIELQLIARILVEKIIFNHENTEQILFETCYLLILLSNKEDLLSELHASGIPKTLAQYYDKISTKLRADLLRPCSEIERSSLTSTKHLYHNHGNITSPIESPMTQLILIRNKMPGNYLFPANINTNKTPILVYMMLQIVLEKLVNLREIENYSENLWQHNGLGNQLIDFLSDKRLLNTSFPPKDTFWANTYAHGLHNFNTRPPAHFSFPDKFAKELVLHYHAATNAASVKLIAYKIIDLRREYGYTFTPAETAWVLNHITRFIPIDKADIATLKYRLIHRPILTDKDYMALQRPSMSVSIEAIEYWLFDAHESEKNMDIAEEKQFAEAAIRAFKVMLKNSNDQPTLDKLSVLLGTGLYSYLTVQVAKSLSDQINAKLTTVPNRTSFLTAPEQSHDRQGVLNDRLRNTP